MSRFKSKLEVEMVDANAAQGRGTWSLTAPLVYESDIVGAGTITVPVGYVTDFASVPRWPSLFFSIFGDIASEAATLHDYLYSTAPFSRYKCDCLLREAALSTGTPHWKAMGLFLGVRIGGSSHYA
jgi:hypothetical protein